MTAPHVAGTTPAVWRTCRDCGRDFAIDAEEQAFLRGVSARVGKPFALPGRCLPCRKFRRLAKYGTARPMTPGDDVTIVCGDCRTPFVFEHGEQRFFASRGFTAPRRCRPCRTARREAAAL